MTNRIVERPTGPRVGPDYEPSLLEMRDRLEHLWRRHVDEVTELTVRLHDTRAALAQIPAGDTRLTAEVAAIEAQLQTARQEFAEYDAALARFARGTYGFCGHCGQTLGTDRLAFLPSARLCASCQFWSRRT